MTGGGVVLINVSSKCEMATSGPAAGTATFRRISSHLGAEGALLRIREKVRGAAHVANPVIERSAAAACCA